MIDIVNKSQHQIHHFLQTTYTQHRFWLPGARTYEDFVFMSTSGQLLIKLLCLLFYILSPSKVISERVPTCGSAHWWRLYSAALQGDPATNTFCYSVWLLINSKIFHMLINYVESKWSVLLYGFYHEHCFKFHDFWCNEKYVWILYILCVSHYIEQFWSVLTLQRSMLSELLKTMSRLMSSLPRMSCREPLEQYPMSIRM